jgi:hypothetical protein
MNEQEEEYWKELEKKLLTNKDNEMRMAAVYAAAEYINGQSQGELGITTLRKAFELGFIKGWQVK